jgi:hypothetical protein
LSIIPYTIDLNDVSFEIRPPDTSVVLFSLNLATGEATSAWFSEEWLRVISTRALILFGAIDEEERKNGALTFLQRFVNASPLDDSILGLTAANVGDVYTLSVAIAAGTGPAHVIVNLPYSTGSGNAATGSSVAVIGGITTTGAGAVLMNGSVIGYTNANTIAPGAVTNAMITAGAGIEQSKIANLVSDLAAINASLAAKANDNTVVKLTGAQTIAGVKTFTSAPVVPASAFPQAAVSGLTDALLAIDTALGTKANASTVVTLTGTQSVSGLKTFTSAQTNFRGSLGLWDGTAYTYGTAGQVLTSGGVGVAPTWSSIPASVTVAGTSGQVLVNGTSGSPLTGALTLSLPSAIAMPSAATAVPLSITAGAATGTDAAGGALTIMAGAATAGNAAGGSVTINAGAKVGTGLNGDIRLGSANTNGIVLGGTGGSGVYFNTDVRMNNATVALRPFTDNTLKFTPNTGTTVTLIGRSVGAGTAYDVVWQGGASSASGGVAGLLSLSGGSGTGTNTSGGALVLTGGARTGTGTLGAITIGATNTASIAIGASGLTTTVNGTLTITDKLAVSNLSAGTDGQVLTMVAGVPAWAAGGGGVTSLTGTADQVNVSASTGAVQLSLPQSIAATSSPTFAGLTVNGASSSRITFATQAELQMATGSTLRLLPFGTTTTATLSLPTVSTGTSLNFDIRAGGTTGSDTKGGTLTLFGGQGNGLNASGGDLYLLGGLVFGTGTSVQGDVYIGRRSTGGAGASSVRIGHSSTTTTVYGTLSVDTLASSATTLTANTTYLQVSAPSGLAFVRGAPYNGVGRLTISGSSSSATSSNGGDLRLTGGFGSGTGLSGVVEIGNVVTSAITIGATGITTTIAGTLSLTNLNATGSTITLAATTGALRLAIASPLIIQPVDSTLSTSNTVFLRGGDNIFASGGGTGGTVVILGGAGRGLNGNGGDVNIDGGAKTGTGTAGVVSIGSSADTSIVRIGSSATTTRLTGAVSLTAGSTLTLATALAATSGGTGIGSYATGDLLYASATNTLSKLAAGTNGYVLTMAGGVPAWAPGGGGGGGVTSIAGTPNQVIASASTGAVMLSLPQSIGTGSSPTFSTLTATTSVVSDILKGRSSSTIYIGDSTSDDPVTLQAGYKSTYGRSIMVKGGEPAETAQVGGDVYLRGGDSYLAGTGNGGNAYVQGGSTNGGTGRFGRVYIGTALTDQVYLGAVGASTYVNGVLGLAIALNPLYGGTGIASYATGDLLYASSPTVLSKLAAGTNGYVLTTVSGVPTWAPGGGGGGGVTSLTGTANQILVGGTTGTPQTGALTLTLPQNIATTSLPQFRQLTINTTSTGTTDAILFTSNSHEQLVKQSSVGSQDLLIVGDIAAAGGTGGTVSVSAGGAGTTGTRGGNLALTGGYGYSAGQSGGIAYIAGGSANTTDGTGGNVEINGGAGAVKGRVIIGGNGFQTASIVIGALASGTQPTTMYGPVTMATSLNPGKIAITGSGAGAVGKVLEGSTATGAANELVWGSYPLSKAAMGPTTGFTTSTTTTIPQTTITWTNNSSGARRYKVTLECWQVVAYSGQVSVGILVNGVEQSAVSLNNNFAASVAISFVTSLVGAGVSMTVAAQLLPLGATPSIGVFANTFVTSVQELTP